MKKPSIAPLVTIIALVVVIASFVYFFVSLNRMEKKIMAVQTSIVDNSAKLSAIVNFINSATNAQTNK